MVRTYLASMNSIDQIIGRSLGLRLSAATSPLALAVGAAIATAGVVAAVEQVFA